ncbi:hypothetical protein CSUI_003854, partial [Cystoisospora suis]
LLHHSFPTHALASPNSYRRCDSEENLRPSRRRGRKRGIDDTSSPSFSRTIRREIALTTYGELTE